jgi:hypothetical protein
MRQAYDTDLLRFSQKRGQDIMRITIKDEIWQEHIQKTYEYV